MNNILEDLKKYFRETPREKVVKDWADTEKFDEVGPKIEDFFEVSKILIKYQGNFWKEKQNFWTRAKKIWKTKNQFLPAKARRLRKFFKSF